MPSHSEKAASDSQLSVLAEEIRHFRKKSQLSLEQLSEVSGVSRSMISKIERCETVPSTVILSRLAEAGVDWVLNTLPPGTETGNFVAHRRGVEEYIYVLKGRLRATIGDDQVMLNEGDSLYFQSDASHSISNVGKGDCQYFLIIDTAKVR